MDSKLQTTVRQMIIGQGPVAAQLFLAKMKEYSVKDAFKIVQREFWALEKTLPRVER